MLYNEVKRSWERTRSIHEGTDKHYLVRLHHDHDLPGCVHHASDDKRFHHVRFSDRHGKVLVACHVEECLETVVLCLRQARPAHTYHRTETNDGTYIIVCHIFDAVSSSGCGQSSRRCRTVEMDIMFNNRQYVQQ